MMKGETLVFLCGRSFLGWGGLVSMSDGGLCWSVCRTQHWYCCCSEKNDDVENKLWTLFAVGEREGPDTWSWVQIPEEVSGIRSHYLNVCRTQFSLCGQPMRSFVWLFSSEGGGDSARGTFWDFQAAEKKRGRRET